MLILKHVGLEAGATETEYFQRALEREGGAAALNMTRLAVLRLIALFVQRVEMLSPGGCGETDTTSLLSTSSVDNS